jgi:hypothetical protein
MQLVQRAATRGTLKLLLRQTHCTSPFVDDTGLLAKLMLLWAVFEPCIAVVLVGDGVGTACEISSCSEEDVEEPRGAATAGAAFVGGSDSGCDDEATITGVIRVGLGGCWVVTCTLFGSSRDANSGANEVGAGCIVKKRLSSSSSSYISQGSSSTPGASARRRPTQTLPPSFASESASLFPDCKGVHLDERSTTGPHIVAHPTGTSLANSASAVVRETRLERMTTPAAGFITPRLVRALGYSSVNMVMNSAPDEHESLVRILQPPAAPS